MARELFHLVENVLLQDKWFDVGRDEIVRQFYKAGRVEIEGELEVVDPVFSGTATVPLRLKVSGVHPYWQGWDMALLMHNRRIDGLGWEASFVDILTGEECSGWHRHMWDSVSGHAKGKAGVTFFDVDDLSVEDFITWGLSEMKILCNRRDDGTDLF